MNEKGRSMVEMLGVLAIIGILSAGGLAGYSKAMFQHRANETINTVSLVLQRLVDLSQRDLGDDFEIQTSDDIVKYGLLESCQVTPNDYCKLPMGELYTYLPHGIEIHFSSAKECIAFVSAHWENALPLEWWTKGCYLNIGGNFGDTFIYRLATDTNKTSLAEMTDICEDMCSRDGVCYVEFGLYPIFH